MKRVRALPILIALAVLAAVAPALADETCNSPYMGNLIKGQEDYVYVWTLGVAGMGDGFDKLVTIDANPSSPQYGKVIHKVSVGGARRGPSHGLHRRPALPLGGRARRQQDLRLRRRDGSGQAQARPPHHRLRREVRLRGAAHLLRDARPDARSGLSNTKDKGGATGLAVYSNTWRVRSTS